MRLVTGFLACVLFATRAEASPPFIPLELPQTGRAMPIVDEPIGARSSLGLTLWHMGHDPQKIGEFHQFLKARGEKIEKLLPRGIAVPAQSQCVLLEPERLPTDKLTGWDAKGEYLVSGTGDIGPQVEIPLTIARAGVYRGWVRFYGFSNGTGVTGLRIYRAGHEAEGPLVNDQIYDFATPKNGPTWQSFMVDLLPGAYTVRLHHIARREQSGTGPGGYLSRNIDALYFTDELWKEAPGDAELQAMRKGAPATQLQINAQPALSPADRAQWREWQVRPLSWESSLVQPQLFALSREFWRQQVDAIGARDYGSNVPDYRDPTRQVIFDDNWNLCANPVQVKRRIDTLNGDLILTPSPYFSYWIQAGKFDHIEGAWGRDGTGLSAGYGDTSGLAATDVAVAQAGDYAVWIRSMNNGYYAPWRLKASAATGEPVIFDHIEAKYPDEWQKAGVLHVDKAGAVRLELTILAYRNPGTYRRISDVLLTTDPAFVPKGSTRPPITLAQYNARARAVGAGEKDAYALWLFANAFTPLEQEVWEDNSWPASGTPQTLLAASNQQLVMTTGSQRAVQVGLRSLRVEPIRLRMSGGDLRGPAGKFPGKVSWRVEGFVPQIEWSRGWSPFLLMRRPWVTVPPRSAAGVWLTVDTTGVPPGIYRSEITFAAKGLPDKKATLQVQVSPAMPPKQPILVGGYTNPPEGEVYTRDYQAHGMNIWYDEMSKADMKRYGIQLLALNTRDIDPQIISARIQRLQSLGLDYDDWMFTILDEPGGATEEQLKPYLDVAKAIRQADPKARICFNPSEAASVATFKILAPYCDVWLPYAIHWKKREDYPTQPWLWYTTPCLWDKATYYPAQIYDQIRQVPSHSGKILGTTFFAFYYPFRDAWDTGHESLPDAAATVLPSRHGPVTTRPWEAIREAGQTANLAQALKEKSAAQNTSQTAEKLIHGSVADLLAALK